MLTPEPAAAPAEPVAVADRLSVADLDRPTPCAGRDVRRLLEHLVGWQRVFVAWPGTPHRCRRRAAHLPGLVRPGGRSVEVQLGPESRQRAERHRRHAAAGLRTRDAPQLVLADERT